MQYPKIEFGSWIEWGDRDSIENSKEPGVYALAKFATAQPSGVDPLDRRIIYFGETCTQNLQQRWKQFDNSAFKQKGGHSGGKTYRAKYPGDAGSNLYVSAMPVPLGKEIENEAIRESFIRYAERKLILDYTLRWKDRPKCNTK